jgi:transcriptional regulator NrdR family protein
MAKEIIKKDGTKQLFDAEKVRKAIGAAATGTGVPDDKVEKAVEQVTNTIIQMVEGKEETTTSEIRERVLSELDSIEPAISEGWRKYDREKKEI